MGTLATLAAAAVITLAGVQPQLATIGDQVYLTFGRGDTVLVAPSSDGGLSFGAPVTLPISGEVSLGMRRGPRVAATNNAVLVAAVSGAQGGGKDGDVVLTRSTDRGRTWSQPVVINDVPGAAREGLHARIPVASWSPPGSTSARRAHESMRRCRVITARRGEPTPWCTRRRPDPCASVATRRLRSAPEVTSV